MDNKITISLKDDKKTGSAYKIISVRMKEDLLDRIDSVSALTNRSRNEVINLMLESAIDLVIIQ